MKPRLKKDLNFTNSSYFKILNNSSGSMLIYVLLVTAAIFTLAVPILNNSIQTYSLSSSSADRIVLNSYQNQVKTLFKNLDICSCNLVNIEFDPAHPHDTNSLKSLRLGCAGTAKTILQKSSNGALTGGVLVNDIYISEISQPTGLSSNEYNVKLFVNTERTSAKTASLRSEPISLTVYTSSLPQHPELLPHPEKFLAVEGRQLHHHKTLQSQPVLEMFNFFGILQQELALFFIKLEWQTQFKV